MSIHVLKAQGLSLREIARRLGISRNTVTRYLASPDRPRYKAREARPTKLEPFHAYIVQRMQAAEPDQIAAPALLRELKAHGYQGQLRSVQAFMQAHRPRPTPDPVVRFETAPGRQMQCDFVVFRRGSCPLYAFTATLGYSRWRWVQFASNEKASTLVACHHALFESLGGVPREILYDLKAVVYDFTEGRSGAHARAFLGDWRGELVCDDYGGYKACFEQGIAEVGCMAHARRKFYELHQSGKSLIAEQALKSIGQLYEIEALGTDLLPEQRRRIREQQARPIAQALHAWMTAHRLKVPDGTGIARALDYSLKRWAALTRYLDDGRLPIDNNWIENQIRPIALGRNKANSVFMRTPGFDLHRYAGIAAA